MTTTDSYTITYTYEGEGMNAADIRAMIFRLTSLSSWERVRGGFRVGHLIGVTDPKVTSTTIDAFGNESVSVSVQDFEVHLKTGQARLMSMITNASKTTSIDGSVTELVAPYSIQYNYNDLGVLIDAQMSGKVHNRTTDAFGNITDSWTTQTFMIVAGQAKVKNVTTNSKSVSVDGTETVTDPYTITYTYEGEGLSAANIKAASVVARFIGRIGHLIGVTDPVVTSTTTDSFGTKTVSVSEQNFKVHAKTGQAKMMSMTTTKSETTSIDGSATTLEAPYTMNYTYDDKGSLIDARMSGKVHNRTTDAFGNITDSWTTQTFLIVAGQATVKNATTESKSLS